MDASDSEGLMEGESEDSDNEGLGLIEGEREGERSYARGDSENGGGDRGGGGVVIKVEGGRGSPLLRWKKLSMLLLRMTDLKDRERFRRCS